MLSGLGRPCAESAENDNSKLDSNIIGIPLEGYGFSNNPQVMRKPTFEKVPPLLDTSGHVRRTHRKHLFCQANANGYSAHGKLLLQNYRW